MNRRTPLSRYTPLRATAALARKTGLRPVKPLEAKSAPKGSAPRKPARDTGPSRLVRSVVLERDGYACVCCGRSVIGQVYSLQHRKRRSQGGTNALSNLVTVLGDGSRGCHARIDSRIDPHDEAKGYTVRSHDDPAQVPVMYFSEHGSGVTAWLCDDGSLSFEAPGGSDAA